MMPATWKALRGDEQPRDWYRMSDLVAAAVGLGVPFGEWEVRKATRHLPKPRERRYGHYRYRREHLEAVLAAARIALDGMEATGVPYAGQR